MNAYRNLGMNNSQLSKNLEKLSSGYRINRAGDDAAGLAISEKMRAQISGLDQAQKNAQSGINLIQTAEGALTEVHDMLNRMVTLSTQAANGTYSSNDQQKIQAEVNALTAYWFDDVLTAKVDGEYKFVKIQLNVFGDAIDENGAPTPCVNWTTAIDNVRVLYVEDGVEIPDPNFAEITSESKTAGYAKMGKTVKASITAKGDGLTYQWFVKNDGASKYTKSSITSATYSIKMSDKVKGRRVYCVVTDKYGNSVQSKTFILRESVSILTAPKSAKAAIGKTVKVSVKASGDGLTYKWYVKDKGASKYTVSKIKSSTYSVKMTSKVNGRRLICYVYDKYGNKVQCETVTLKKK